MSEPDVPAPAPGPAPAPTPAPPAKGWTPRRTVTVVVAAVVVVLAGLALRDPSLPPPRTTGEIFDEIFDAPGRAAVEPAKALATAALREGLIAFIMGADLPDEGARDRLVAHVRDGTFEETTVPFLFYLRDLYGDIAASTDGEHADLAYDAPAPDEPGDDGAGGDDDGGASPSKLAYAQTLLRVYDALFLRVKPDAPADGPMRERYDPSAYEEIKAIVREAFSALVRPTTGDDPTAEPKAEYEHALEEFLGDEQRLTDLAEFLTDLFREQALDWLEAWTTQERRRAARIAWVERRIAENRYHEIADWAAARQRRRLAIHVVVDGLQGLLLEGLARLSDGDRDHPASRYVRDLVARFRDPRFAPEEWGADQLPRPLGETIQELADGDVPPSSGTREFLETFKNHFFADAAPSVIGHGVSVDTPSISVRNLPIAFSGHAPGGPQGTGIPNFSYLDRPTGRGWYFWGSDVVHLERIFGNREDEIPNGKRRPEGPGARMLHERLDHLTSMSVGAVIDTGATEKLFGHFAIPAGEIKRDIVERTALVRLRARAAREAELAEHRAFLAANRDLRRTFFGALFTNVATLDRFHDAARFLAEHEDEGLPDYLLFYDAWPDHFAHYTGPFHDDIVGWRGEYDRLDFFLGKVLDVYAGSPAPGEDGRSLLDRALVAVTSDHGLTYTPHLVSTDALLFDAIRAEGKEIRYLKLTHDEGGLPAIHSEDNLKSTRGYDAVVGSTAGGSYIVDLFYPEEKDWLRHPGYHDLRALPLRGGGTLDWVDAVKRHLKDHLDVAVVRERGPALGEGWPAGVDVAVRVFSPSADARITRFEDGRIRYEVLGGEDPLDLVEAVREWLVPEGRAGVPSAKEAIAAAMADPKGRPDAEWVELLSRTTRLDAVPQLVRLYDSERAGTLNIFPALHVGMNSSVVGRHAGEAFEEKNATILFRGPGLGPARRLQAGRAGQVPVTIYGWLDGSDMEGFGYRSFLEHDAFEELR